MPTSGGALNRVALSATLHCLTGCAIGEVLGMIIGTALGFSNLGTIVLAVALAFLFGYALTSLPLLRAGLAVSAVIPIALASDTLSIAVTREITRQQAELMRKRVARAPIECVEPTGLAYEAWVIADELGWARATTRTTFRSHDCSTVGSSRLMRVCGEVPIEVGS